MPPPPPKEPRRRGRPPIHLSASLNLVLPSQLFPQFPGEGHLPGEKRLMLAVLEDAVHIFAKYHTCTDARGCRLFAETLEWVLSDDVASPFSFVNVCETLGLSPSCLRRGLKRWDELARARDRPEAGSPNPSVPDRKSVARVVAGSRPPAGREDEE